MYSCAPLYKTKLGNKMACISPVFCGERRKVDTFVRSLTGLAHQATSLYICYVVFCLYIDEKRLENPTVLILMPVNSLKFDLDLKAIYCYVRSNALIGCERKPNNGESDELNIGNCEYGRANYFVLGCCVTVWGVGPEISWAYQISLCNLTKWSRDIHRKLPSR